MSAVTALEWMKTKRCSPAQAYADLLLMSRRGEAVMHPPVLGLWWRKWDRRLNTRFGIDT